MGRRGHDRTPVRPLDHVPVVATRSGRDARTGRGRGSCLVAVDGTRAGVDALVWGMRHAVAHGMDVEVLTVWPAHRSVLVREVPGHFCAPRWSARLAQENTLREAIRAVPAAPTVVTTLENADTAEAIVRASARHELVVLGCSGEPHDSHRLTRHVLEHAACDVVVVGPPGVDPLEPLAPDTREGALP